MSSSVSLSTLLWLRPSSFNFFPSSVISRVTKTPMPRHIAFFPFRSLSSDTGRISSLFFVYRLKRERERVSLWPWSLTWNTLAAAAAAARLTILIKDRRCSIGKDNICLNQWIRIWCHKKASTPSRTQRVLLFFRFSYLRLTWSKLRSSRRRRDRSPMARAVRRDRRRSSLSTPTTTTDDESDDSSRASGYQSSPQETVRYLTPQKYRRTQQAQLVKASLDYTSNHREEPFDNRWTSPQRPATPRTPSPFRLRKAFSSTSFASHDEVSAPRQKEEKLLYNRYPIVVGEFILAKKPVEDTSIYSYRPKHTRLPLVYKGIAHGSEVQQRAFNEMKQLIHQRSRTSSTFDGPPNGWRSARNERPFTPESTESPYQRLPPTSALQDHRYYFGGRVQSILHEEEKSPGLKKRSAANYRMGGQFLTTEPSVVDLVLTEVADVGTETESIFREPSPFALLTYSGPRPAAIKNRDASPERRYRPTTSTMDSSSDPPSSVGNEGNHYELQSLDGGRSVETINRI